jgi:hypothetical protein
MDIARVSPWYGSDITQVSPWSHPDITRKVDMEGVKSFIKTDGNLLEDEFF